MKGGKRADERMAPALKTLAALVSGMIFTLVMGSTGMLARLDNALYDSAANVYARIRSGAAESRGTQSVEVVFIDQYSLGWVEEHLGLTWPWPREIYGVMAGYFREAAAQTYDILFSEGSIYGPGDDERCAAAMDEAGNVVLALPVDRNSGTRLRPLPTAGVVYGSVRGLVDRDGVLRRYGLRFDDAGGELPSLAVAALEVAATRGGDLPGRGIVYPRFRGASPSLPSRNAAEILAAALGPSPDTAEFRGKYVFIGFSAPGLLDLQAVPTDAAMPGVEIHATVAADYLGKGLAFPLPGTAAGLISGLFLLLASWISTRFRKPVVLGVSAFAFAVGPLIAVQVVFLAGGAAALGAGLAGGLFSFATGIILSYVTEGKMRVFLKRSFSQYLSPQVIDELLRNPGRLSLGGEERTITVFFSDIQGFTSLAESMDAPRLAAFMNEYLTAMTDIILDEGGTVDKYVGDAIVAFWNAPLDQPDHALRAVRAALRCQGLGDARTGVPASVGPAFPMTRIGLHTGKAVVGNMGSPRRFNYTALGDVMNTGSRLEAANKTVGTRILASASTVAAAAGQSGMSEAGPDFSAPTLAIPSCGLEFRRLGMVAVEGKKAPVEVWEPRFADAEYAAPAPWEGTLRCGKD